MKETIPGTCIVKADSNAATGLEFLSGIFSVTSGLMLSQVKEMTGLEAPALQNWIKRGWVPSPVNKRYSIDQVARILIINMLRDVLQLEKIAFLLSYINGELDDKTDDIISESILYDYICKILLACGDGETLDYRKAKLCIQQCTSDYVETISGAAQRLHQSLHVIITAYISAKFKMQAEEELKNLR